MKNITFATLATPNSVVKTILFIESLRRFGGEYATSPVQVVIPAHGGDLPESQARMLAALGAQKIPFEMPPELQTFPLALVAAGAAVAEDAAAEEPLLAWMLPDTLVLNPPVAFHLPDGVDFAYRPVHHTLVGSIYDQPLDPFWSTIYRHCETPSARLFPMQTCLRDHTLRPYFNAGLAVLRPGLGLLCAWNRQFTSLAHHPDFESFYQQDGRYAVFMHQAVLSAVIPTRLVREQILELPENINYPLHLHADYPATYRPEKISRLATCRYEEFEVLREALEAGLFAGPQQSWLEERLAG